MHKCLIDGQEFETREMLHNYIARRLKVKLEDYYPQYVPRYDLLTHEPIKFKNFDFYFHSLFNSRVNLVQYFKKYPGDIGSLKECLALRKTAKNLRFAPSTVEARISVLPAPLLVQRIGQDYNKICKELGMETRYDYGVTPTYDRTRPLEVIVDTREQRPLNVGTTTISKIDFGDYVSTSHYNKVFVERKSLPDLCGTLSKGYERLQKELGRAKEMGCYLVVMVEEPLGQLLKVGKTPSTLNIQASPEFLASRVKNICQHFDNVQFLFVENRVYMVDIMEKVFRMKNDVRTIDLQFMYDSKAL